MILEAKSIEKSFLQGQKKISVLKKLNLLVAEEETVAILGKSGSGKSTLLSLLSGLDTPDSGALNLLDKDIFQMDEESLTQFRANSLGIVFQNFHLLPHLTAKENIALPLEILGLSNARERSLELLKKVGLSERGAHLPSQLSGGEKQRVAVARALAAKPGLILADEPSGSLDEETGEQIMDLIFDLVSKEKRSMILVTHDRVLAKRCSRQLVLEHGVLNALS
ncbi:MAG: ATP-binding cassette domain-containing protein [Bdellovibrionaceae bacterium]|jgi:putative ABC transport system ATP-binding protein|nr:ATP-binding cassette domain-containing protein [Pseudobdellovibrionaceae bacterium]